MARAYCNILTSIWEDADFCALSAGAQRTYFMLVTQPDIAACGTLPLTLRRWSLTLPSRERKNLAKWLDELSVTAFVVMEERTEELLVRTFVKHDGGFKNPKRLAAIWATASVIRSPSIRSAFGIEMAKLGLSNGNRMPIEGHSEGVRTPIERPRVVVTLGDTDSTTPNPQPGGASASEDAEPSPFCPRHPNGTDEKCGDCGTARRRYDLWHKNKPHRDAAKRKHATMLAAVAAECPICEGTHFVLDEDKRPTTRKCNHGRTA